MEGKLIETRRFNSDVLLLNSVNVYNDSGRVETTKLQLENILIDSSITVYVNRLLSTKKIHINTFRDLLRLEVTKYDTTGNIISFYANFEGEAIQDFRYHYNSNGLLIKSINYLDTNKIEELNYTYTFDNYNNWITRITTSNLSKTLFVHRREIIYSK